MLANHGHQADLRLGIDCAELAIYGRRRMGENIPYVGPRGIKDYLEKTDNVEVGVVLHFGFQVSVLYEDRGKIGKIDEADLLIHAYEDKAEIIELGKTDLWKWPFEMFVWK